MIQYSSVKICDQIPFSPKNVWVFISKDLDEGNTFNMVEENIFSHLPLILDRRDDKIFQLQKDSVPEFY